MDSIDQAASLLLPTDFYSTKCLIPLSVARRRIEHGEEVNIDARKIVENEVSEVANNVVDNDVRGVNVQDGKLGEVANKMVGNVHSVGVLNRALEAVASRTEGAVRNMDTLSMAFDACRAI